MNTAATATSSSSAATTSTTAAIANDSSAGVEKRAVSVGYQIHRIEWAGIMIELRYNPDWSPTYRDVYGYPLAHLEIESVMPPRAPLPMTETGYHSHFGAPADVDAEGGSVGFSRK